MAASRMYAYITSISDRLNMMNNAGIYKQDFETGAPYEDDDLKAIGVFDNICRGQLYIRNSWSTAYADIYPINTGNIMNRYGFNHIKAVYRYSTTEQRWNLLSNEVLSQCSIVISYTADNKQNAMDRVNNPMKYYNITPYELYTISFRDSVGDSVPFGGGNTLIMGYSYEWNGQNPYCYGAQIYMRYSGAIAYRNCHATTGWSDWKSLV